MSVFDRPASRRRGCGGCLVQSALALLLGCALLYAVVALLAPWNFYFGGHFHFIPGWSGQASFQPPYANKSYYLWIRFTPTTPGYRKSPLKGIGLLCTPEGKKFNLHFGGDMPRSHGSDLRGVPLHLYFSNWPAYDAFTGSHDPHFDLYGAFGDSVLTLDDRGTFAHVLGQSKSPETTHITLTEDNSWRLTPSCPSTTLPTLSTPDSEPGTK